MEAKMDMTISEVLTVAGSLGLDIDDVRTILPDFETVADSYVESCLKRGQVTHRLNVSAKLYGIIESPKTTTRDLIAAERHLREVHTKQAGYAVSQELFSMLHNTVPVVPPASGVVHTDEDVDNEEC
jgi:hypothetical protein